VLSYELVSEPGLGGCGAAGGAGLYTTAGLAGAPFCLISFFFGFFFSRPRVSRLPMTSPPRVEIWPPRPTATPSTCKCLMNRAFHSFSCMQIPSCFAKRRGTILGFFAPIQAITLKAICIAAFPC
jgi:hypothetical protein